MNDNKEESKVAKNKQHKRKSLLDAAYDLFIAKGFQKTSISEIVDSAGVAKGTFYLYFKDKYDLRDKLTAHKASEVFRKADVVLQEAGITQQEERIIFLIDNIIGQFVLDKNLLRFISKNLSWGVFKNVLIGSAGKGDVDFYDIYKSVFASDNRYESPEIMIFMIIELVGSTCYSSIIYNEPVEIGRLKPYVFRTVRNIMEMHRTPCIS